LTYGILSQLNIRNAKRICNADQTQSCALEPAPLGGEGAVVTRGILSVLRIFSILRRSRPAGS